MKPPYFLRFSARLLPELKMIEVLDEENEKKTISAH